MLQNPNTTRSPAASQLGREVLGSPVNSNIFFSHHQKSVIVDGNKAFLGGIDLAYGRWDTNACDVVIDRSLHVINDAYNGQISPYRATTADEKKLTEDSRGRPGFAAPYKTNGNDNGRLLDEAAQPRQPWQDIALRIDGPAAFDVFVNFVLRWNSFAGSGTNYFDSGMDVGWFERAKGQASLIDPLKRGTGSVSAQICRSASSAQLKDELKLWNNDHKYVNDDWKSFNPERRKRVQAARAAWAGEHQTSIRDAMINCIRSAQAFIYIENQFFMSDCGADQNGTAAPSSNPIIRELSEAIARAIYAGRPFHVWLVLPEHPEGKMEEDGTKAQTWWALQGVKRARNSLIHRINANLFAKHRQTWGIAQPAKTNNEISLHLASHGMLNEWRKYLTVLNVRNYGHAGKTVISEMIYVHSKLTIVDDAVAIIGSANINDRSLNGNGDTELAAVIVDDAEAQMTDVGGGIRCITRKFARDLRQKLWQKHLGMLIDQKTTGVQKQGVPAGVAIDRPLDAGTISGIQKLATQNRAAYNAVFVHTARDSYGTLTEGRIKSYSYTSHDRTGAARTEFSLTVTPPLQPAFMDAQGKPKAGEALAKLAVDVKGFWVEMPLDWGSKESATPKAPQNSPQFIATNTSASPTTREA
jgi:phospholipase D1/2